MKKYICLLLLFVGSLLGLHAQIGLSVKADRTDLIPGEPVEITVRITNRTGQTLNLQNVGKMPWLSLNAVANNDTELSQTRTLNLPPLKLEPGKSTASKIMVSQLYDLTKEGTYKIYAVVHSASDSANYMSNKAYLTVRGGVSMWSQIVGIPKGMPGAGGSARYSLLSMSTKKGTDLYVKIDDVSSGRIIRCARLGAWERFSKPLARIDATNRLHVLFLNTASIYAHSSVDVAGRFAKNLFYKRLDSTSPNFVTDGSGKISVTGALPYDPYAKKEPIRSGGENPF